VSDSTPPPADSADQSSTRSGTSSTATETGWRRWSVLLPALTFAVGLALGAAVVGVSQLGGSDEADPLAAPSPSSSPASEPTGSASPGALRITVPAPCVQAAEKAETAYGVLDRAVTAVRELDARQLADVVDAAQTERAETEALVDACRAAAGEQLLEPVPTTAPTPSG